MPDRYIVVLDEKALAAAQVGLLARQLAEAHGGSVERVYSHALQGFAATMSEAAALQLSNDPRVRYVEEDAKVHLDSTQANATWGLDRIDQQGLPLDNTYYYGFIGAGVHAYVIDTGIRISHAEFGARAVHGFTAIEDGYGSYDCHGHGTHVAGTIGGASYGVAKAVALHAVRVIDCSGNGTLSGVIAGVDWVTANHVKPAVANMSLGGPASQSLDDAVTNSINAGVFYAVAAGNSSWDACFQSPARAPAAMTVGATDGTDARAYFSNYGSCVDLFAPGQGITSAWNADNTSTNTISGTSMATPHVVGTAALYLEGHPLAPPDEVSAALTARATADKVINPGAGSPNRMLYAGCMGANRTPPQAALTAPSAGSTLRGTVTLAAAATDDEEVARVEFFLDDHLIGADITAPYELVWNTAAARNGSGMLTARAYDASCNQGVSTPVGVTIENAGNAAFAPSRGAPACTTVGTRCDSTWLLEGRAGLGPEIHAPNTIGSSCADGAEGTYRSSPSLERLVVSRNDGTAFAGGKEVTVQATVFASAGYAQEALDLYAASDANAPTWSLLATLQPSAGGLQVLSTTYLLPAGGVQALRGVYRSGGSAAACITGPLNDHDDLVFAVGVETDPTLPAVAITSPAAGATVEGVLVVNVAASDNFGVQRVELYDGSTLVATGYLAPYALSWATRSAPNGPHALTARAYDAAGLVSDSATVNVLVNNDHTLPQVSFVTPTDGATVNETLSVEVSASDDRGVTRVDFYVDGSLLGSRTAAPYAMTWSSRTVPNGPHVLGATARDAAGNTSPTVAVNVSVDNDYVPPETTLTAPVNGTIVVGTVTLQATASDNRQVARVDFLLNGGLVAMSTAAPYSLSWDSRTFANGSYTLQSRAFDAAGLSATSAPVTVEVRNPGNARYDPVLKAPRCDTLASSCDTVNLLPGRGRIGSERNAPNTLDGCMDGSSGAYHRDESIERIRISSNDGQPMAAGKSVHIMVDVWAYNNGSADSLDLYYAADATQPSWTYITTLWPRYGSAETLSTDYILPAGELQAVRANFRFWGSASPCTQGEYNDHDDVVFPVYSDTMAPTVAITSPAVGATVSGTVTLTASASDNYGVVAVDFYDGNTLLDTVRTAPYRTNWDTWLRPNGSHTLTARARDASGNVGISQPVTVTVDNDHTPPQVSIMSPASGATLIGTVTVSANATDNKDVVGVEFDDGAGLICYVSTPPFSCSWSTAYVPTGEHVLTAKARDSAGNVGTSAQVTVVVGRDTTPPTASITAPAGGATLNGTVTISANGADEFGVTRLEFLLDGTSLGSSTSSPYSLSWNTRTAANGSHTLTARATDSSGNIGTSAGVVVTLDNDFTAPTVSIVSPGGLALLKGTVSIQANATDNRGVSQVEFYADGTLIGTDTSAPYAASWNSATMTDDYHTLTAKAYDTSGNSWSSSIWVRTDNTLPNVTLTSPAPGALIRGSVVLEVAASDNRAVSRVEFYDGSTLIGMSGAAPYSISWNSVTTTDGTHTLTAKAWDDAGNVRTSAGLVVTIDNTPPTTAVTSPAASAQVRGTVQVNASASDGQAIARVEFYADGALIGTDTTAPYAVSWDTTTRGNGTALLSTRAYDTAGNSAQSADRAVSVDNSPPTVAITSPQNGASLFLSATLQASASDNVGISQVVFYDGATAIGTDTTAPYSMSWNLLNVPKGAHTLTAKAYDLIGNVTISAPVSVTVR